MLVLGALAAVVLMVFLLLFEAGGAATVGRAAGWFDNAGAPWSWLGNALRTVWNTLHGWIYGSLAAGVGAVSALFETLWRPHDQLHRSTQRVGEATANRFSRLRSDTLPITRAEAVNTAAIYTNQVRAQLYQSLSAVNADLTASIRQLRQGLLEQIAKVDFTLTTALDTERARAEAAEGSIVSSTDTALRTLTATTRHRLDEVGSYAKHAALGVEQVALRDLGGLETALRADLAALGRYAEQVAGQAEHDATTALDGATAAGVGAIWGAIEPSARRAATEVGAEAAPGVAGVYAPPTTAPTTIAEAIVAALTMAGTATAFVDTCGAGLCSNLSTFGKDFSRLSTLLMGAGFAAFVAAAYEEPTAMAAGAADVAFPIATGVVQVLKAIV